MTMNDLGSTLVLDNGRPLYLQVKDAILAALGKGIWKPGDQLPTEPELSRHFSVSEGTIRQAVVALVKEGRLTRRSGKGTFVARPNFERSFARFFRFRVDDRSATDPDFRLAVIDIRTVSAAGAAVASVLGLRGRAKVLAIHRTITQDGIVVCHYVSYLSHVKFGSLLKEDLENAALYDILESRCRVHIVKASETLQARAATAEDAGILGVRKNDPVIAIERVAYTYGERAVEVRRTIGRSDKFRYEIELR